MTNRAPCKSSARMVSPGGLKAIDSIAQGRSALVLLHAIRDFVNPCT